MSSIADVIGKIHLLTSLSLEVDLNRTTTGKSKCVCCGVDAPKSSVNFFETYGRRLKTLFGINFKPRSDSIPTGPGVQSIENLWTMCNLCLKQLEVAELLFWKVFRTHDMEVLVTTLEDGRELYQLRQSGVPVDEAGGDDMLSSGVIMNSGDAAEAVPPPAKRPKRNTRSSGRAKEEIEQCETADGNGEAAAPGTAEDDDTEYASLVPCDFCGNYILEMEKGTVQEHRRTCTKNPMSERREPENQAAAMEEPVVNEIESISFYVCHLCNGPVKTEELLRQHYLTVHKQVPDDLSQNKTTSTNVCPWCMAPFQSAKAKKRHMTSKCVKKPGSKAAEAAAAAAENSPEQQQFKCKYCSLLFPSQRSRFNHFYRAHNRYK